jgi:integration host factor subunit alpha
MTKADLARAVQRRVPGLNGKECAELVEQVFETMKEMLGRGERVKIAGFGTLGLRDKRARRGRNPLTGEDIVIVERRVLFFDGSVVLRQVLNPRESVHASVARATVAAPIVEREPLWEP